MKGALVATAAAALAGGVSAGHIHHRHAHDLFNAAKRGQNDSEVCVPGCTTIYTTIVGAPTLYTPPAPPAASQFVNTTSIVVPTTASVPVPVTPSSVPWTTAPVPATSSSVPAPSSSAPAPSSSAPVSSPSAPATSSSVPATSAPVPTTSSATAATSSAPPATSTAPVTVPTPIAYTCPTPGTYTFPATTVVLTETATVCGASSTSVPAGTHTLGGVTTVVETATTVVCPYATTSTHGSTVTSIIQTTTYVCPSAGTYTIAPVTTSVASPTTVIVPVVSTFGPGTYTAPALVTTVVETDYVVYCPFADQTPTTSAAPMSSSSSSSSNTPASVSTTPAALSSTAAASPPTSAPASSSSAPAASSSSSSSSSSSVTSASASASESKSKTSSAAVSTASASTGGGLGTGGSQWAITYTPYSSSGECKGAQTVKDDLAKIAEAGFSTVRVYSTDCDTLSSVGAGCEAAGLKMILGIYIGEVGCDNAHPDVAEQISSIKSWAKWELVELVVVGNEALYGGYCTVAELTDLIGTVKKTFGGAGYAGPYTTTDVVASYLDNDVSAICDAVDVVAANAHAYFNDATLPAAAGAFVAGQLALVEGVCGKKGYIMETGWPSSGVCNGEACAGFSEQEEAIASIKATLGGKVVFFSFGDDTWKEPGTCECEQHWGCGKLFGA